MSYAGFAKKKLYKVKFNLKCFLWCKTGCQKFGILEKHGIWHLRQKNWKTNLVFDKEKQETDKSVNIKQKFLKSKILNIYYITMN